LTPALTNSRSKVLGFEALVQGDDGLLVVHVELLDLHRAEGFEGVGFAAGRARWR
jgi:hypothetical protein